MKRDLSEVFVEEDKSSEFTRMEEELILPISIDNSVIFRFESSLKNFDFDTDRDKAYEMLNGIVATEEFDEDLNKLRLSCKEAYPSGWIRGWVSSFAVMEMFLASVFLLIIWVILILDIVVLAAELYLLRKLKKIVWRWRESKIDKVWIEKIEFSLVEFNTKYERSNLCFKFDCEGKWIQLCSLQRITDTMCN